MRIAIEAQRLFRQKKHGMDVVALELIRNLQRIDKTNEYLVFVKCDFDVCIMPTDNFRIIVLDQQSYPIWEQVSLPRAVKKLKCDILHCTSNTAPEIPGIPLVLTLHDIIYMEGSWFSLLQGKGTAYQRFGNMYRRHVVPVALKNSERIITVSEFEKSRITDRFHLDPSKLSVVYNGVGDHFRKVTDHDYIQKIRVKYNLPDRYILFLGNTAHKKNTPGTLLAYSLFREQTNLDIPLVMLDFKPEELTAILEEIMHPELISHIHLIGYVKNAELPAIYSLADLFLYPSFRESFGIPILEAQSCGTPVITSNVSSMPEVAGDAALLINPSNPADITQAMMQLTHDQLLRQSIIEKGIQNASKFSWRSMAEHVLNIYMEVGQRIK